MIVVDTNLVSYLLIEGKRTVEARQVRQRDPDCVLPPLWRGEFLNGPPHEVTATSWGYCTGALNPPQEQPTPLYRGGAQGDEEAVHAGFWSFRFHEVPAA